MDAEKRIRAITNTGPRLSDQMELALTDVRSLDIIVSFVKHSGVNILRPILKRLSDGGAHIRILTSTYLGITDPFALRMLHRLGSSDLEVHIFDDNDRSFHPKTYIIRHTSGDLEAFIGSSNISRSAFVEGVEWNYRLDSRLDYDSIQTFCDEFDRLFNTMSVPLTDELVNSYEGQWVDRDLLLARGPGRPIPSSFEPTGAQQLALDSLRESRMQDQGRALVVMATGTGKTVLSALDSKDASSVLFIAHRKEILRQARDTFVKVHGLDPRRDCGLLDGDNKQIDRRYLFASIFTLAKGDMVERIGPGRFEYVVVDEFHHAMANSYRKVIERLEPRFLLGLTATPDRMDSQDVRQLCNDNVVYEIDMPDAIRFGYLVPFDYWGICDDFDYDAVGMRNGHYDLDDLTERYRTARKSDTLIVDNYLHLAGKRTIAFCATREHAKDMRDLFLSKGIESRIVVSSSSSDGIVSDNRENAIRELVEGSVKIVFTVDVFNEGVDIPSVDTVMFLRPTESQTVFLQQLGRGLRLHDGKRRLTVIDFIGNYYNADRIPSWLTGKDIPGNAGGFREYAPFMCNLNFDMESIDIMTRMAERCNNILEVVKGMYYRFKNEHGRRPTRVELMGLMDTRFYGHVRNNKRSPFKNYLRFLHDMGETTFEEGILFESDASELLRTVENTRFDKMYKAALLYAIHNEGRMRLSVTNDEIIDTFREFYSHHGNRFDIPEYRCDDLTAKDLKRMSDNPRKVLSKDKSGFFVNDEDSFSLDGRFGSMIGSRAFANHFKDVLDYRVANFKRSYQERTTDR